MATAILTLAFNKDINISLAAKATSKSAHDIIYFATLSNDNPPKIQTVRELGKCIAKDTANKTINVEVEKTGGNVAIVNTVVNLDAKEILTQGVGKIKTNGVTNPSSITGNIPVAGNYVFFQKNKEIGTSGVIGYYAEVKMEHDSTSKVNLFAVSSEIFESSK